MDNLKSALYTLVLIVISINFIVYIFKFLKFSFNKNSDKLRIAPRYLLILDGIFIVLLIGTVVELIATRRIFSYYLIILLFLVVYELTTRLFVVYDNKHVLVKRKIYHRNYVVFCCQSNASDPVWNLSL